MARGPGSILKKCSEGRDFASLARASFALEVQKVVYVDIAAGSDGNTGETWETPKISINAALDTLTAGKGGYIICRAAHDTAVASATTLDTIDVDGVHVIGASGALNPYTPGYAQRRRSSAADLPTVLISADDVEYAGFEVQGKMSSGGWSAAQPKSPLRVGSTTDGTERNYIHNVSVRDPGYAATTGGVAVVGSHYTVLEDISIRSVANTDVGLWLIPGVDHNRQTIIKNAIIGGTGQGTMAKCMEIYDSSASLYGAVLDNIWFMRNTNCIDLNTAANTYAQITNFTSHTVIATSFSGGSAAATKANLVSNYAIVSHGWCSDGVWA